MNLRNLLAACLGAVVLLGGAWYLYAGRGLVSLDFQDAPLSRVLDSISRQGGLDIATNLDPATPVTIQVKRVPAVEALDIVAVRTEASWRLAYLGAPQRAAIDAALSGFRTGSPLEGWVSFGGGGFGGMLESPSGAALDLRRAVWQPSGQTGLQALMEEASDRTGVLVAAPDNWTPSAAAPRPGPAEEAIPAFFGQAGGVCREVFLLRGRSERGEEPGPGRGARGGGTWIGRGPQRDGDGGRGGGRTDPARWTERLEAQIALLPAAEQEQARQETSAMRAFWESVRDLPEEERRAKAREFFSRPEIQERMEDRRLAREAKMTPQQRIDRAKRYFERKREAAGRTPEANR